MGSAKSSQAAQDPVSLNILDAIVESKVREDLVWENKRTTIPK